MNFRELLQIQIWSKRTTRKILVWFGIVFVIGFLALNGWHFVELHWLTGGERNAAKAALAQIEALQDAGTLSDDEFALKAKQAEAKVKAAQDAAVTYRDTFMEMDLSWYLIATESERRTAQRLRLEQRENLSGNNQDGERRKRIESLIGNLGRDRRAALHKELD